MEFRDVFAQTVNKLGCTDLAEMEIKEVPGSQPVQCRPYRTTAANREAIKTIVQEWKELGIMSETRSLYASPVL
jgi:ribosomal protein S19E (S16A)